MPRARKSGPARAGASPGAKTPAGDTKTRLIVAALDLAARQGWRKTGMDEVAREAKVPLAEAYQLFPTRMAVLVGFARQINDAVLASGEAEGSTREKLFDLLMRRFDALKPHRAAIRAILRDSVGDPRALCGAPMFLNSMAWMLEAAGISAAGWRGPMRVFALAGIYGAVFREFLGDDSEDLAKTMAALDRRLKSGPFGRNEPAADGTAA
jgi:AcrR family transcriptional regulator